MLENGSGNKAEKTIKKPPYLCRVAKCEEKRLVIQLLIRG